MEIGQKVICTRDWFTMNGHTFKIPDLDRNEVYEIVEVKVGRCGCGGDRLVLDGVQGSHCTKGFLLATEVVDIYKNIQGKLTISDFDALEQNLDES